MPNLGTPFDPRRRELLKGGAAVLASLLLAGPAGALAAGFEPPGARLPDPDQLGDTSLGSALGAGSPVPGVADGLPRSLSFFNTHTNEHLEAVYWSEGTYRPDAMRAIDRILRDHRTGEVKAIDPGLLDLLHALKTRMATKDPFHVISGYRSAATNALLRSEGHGVAAHSLHVEGQAIDIRVPGTRLRELRDTAVRLGRGGVGYYPSSDFVHIDVGRPRDW
jgi:uncharacterized protein YcbK (DUF882 family)